MKNVKRILALALVIMSVFAIAAPALAELTGIEEYLGTSNLFWDPEI